MILNEKIIIKESNESKSPKLELKSMSGLCGMDFIDVELSPVFIDTSHL